MNLLKPILFYLSFKVSVVVVPRPHLSLLSDHPFKAFNYLLKFEYLKLVKPACVGYATEMTKKTI